jgi:hypothetical protein
MTSSETCDQPKGRLVDQFAGIPADLVTAVNELAHQRQPWRPEDLPQRERPGVAGADVCNPIVMSHIPERSRTTVAEHPEPYAA